MVGVREYIGLQKLTNIFEDFENGLSLKVMKPVWFMVRGNG